MVFASLFQDVKRLVKICLGIFDIATDFVTGYNSLSGEFSLGLYFASKTREFYEEAPYNPFWGSITLSLPWLPGLLRIAYLAHKQDWRGVSKVLWVKRIVGYFMTFLVWPVFSVLM